MEVTVASTEGIYRKMVITQMPALLTMALTGVTQDSMEGIYLTLAIHQMQGIVEDAQDLLQRPGRFLPRMGHIPEAFLIRNLSGPGSAGYGRMMVAGQ